MPSLQEIHAAIDKAFAAADYKKALDLCTYALAVQPLDPVIPRAKGKIYGKLQDHKRAKDCFTKSLKLFGDNAEDHFNLGLCNSELFLYEEAITHFDVGLKLMPKYAPAYLQRGAAHWELRHWDEAMRDFEMANRLKPDDPNAQWVLGLLQLQIGNFKDGWANYDKRWGSEKFKSPKLQTNKPEFATNKRSKSVLIWGEQGIGDQIIYGSMLPAIRNRTDKVTAMVDRRLIPLFERSMPDIEFMSAIDRIRADLHETHLPFASIGRVFINHLDDISKHVARKFLRADPKRVAQVHEEMKLKGEDFVVGVSWGSAAIKIGPHKSVKLTELLPVLSVPGCKFVDVQYGDFSKEKQYLKEQTGIELLKPNVDMTMDLDGLAAVLSCCDVLVACSSSTVHLAGALGIPVLLMDANKLWYWGNKDGDRSLWYPSVRIFPREAMNKPWTPVIAQVAKELEALCKAKT